MKKRKKKVISILEIFINFLFLGLTSFGGPIAHVSFFRDKLIIKKKWLEEKKFADYLALCQFLPGPTSSQLGIAIGLDKGGIKGAIAAWSGFTLPSAFIMIAFGYGVVTYSDIIPAGSLHGLKIAVVSVVAQAVLGMARTLTPDFTRQSMAFLVAIFLLFFPGPFSQILSIIFGGFFWVFFKKDMIKKNPTLSKFSTKQRNSSIIFFLTFCILLIGLPILAGNTNIQIIKIFDSFFRSGSLVFGGGHVVLPLLQSETVYFNWVNTDNFMAGYGAAQAIPGPLFTFSAYLGTVMNFFPNGWIGGMICLFFIFLPSFLLVFSILPYWENLRKYYIIQRALIGINASVVGLLLSAFWHPVCTSSLLSSLDICLAIFLFLMLFFFKTPPAFIVLIAAIMGWVFSFI